MATKLFLGDPDLGIVSDAEIAARHGVARSTVRGYRSRLGIPSPVLPPLAQPIDDPDLGKEPDRVIAARLGVSRALVQLRRQERGIPAGTPPSGTPPRTQESVCGHWGAGEAPWGLAYWCARCGQWALDPPKEKA